MKARKRERERGKERVRADGDEMSTREVPKRSEMCKNGESELIVDNTEEITKMKEVKRLIADKRNKKIHMTNV